jgi:hypothetical protein
MKRIRTVFELGQAAILVGGIAYWAINQFGAPWPVGLLMGLCFLATVSAIRFSVSWAMRRHPGAPASAQ